MVEQKQFSGILNLDDNNDVLPSRHHKYALNVHFRGNPGNARIENIPGNRLITNSLPAGTNQCIGAIYDDVRHRIYYFNYNSNGRNGIYYYDTIAKTITTLLLSYTNSAADILNFNPSYPIVSINIMYKDTTDGDTLYWTDRLNRPQYLNIKDALANKYGSSWLATYLTVARPMPLISPICAYRDDSLVTQNNLRTKLFQFRYRWIYNDNTKSTWSPYSKMSTPSDPNTLTTVTNPAKNNNISVQLTTGGANVLKIEIAARRNLDTTWENDLSIVTLDKASLFISDNTNYIYYFYNNDSYAYTDLAESTQLFDYVPKKANTQELINGNLPIYGGITEGNTFDSVLDTLHPVTSLITNNNGAGTTPMTISTNSTQGAMPNNNSGYYYFYMTGNPQIGDVISIQLILTDNSKAYPYKTTSVTIPYPVASTVPSVVQDGLYNALSTNATVGNYHITVTTQASPLAVRLNSNTGNSEVSSSSVNITYFSSGSSTDINIAAYKHNSLYKFGLVYFDEYGVTNGVSTNDSFNVITSELTSTNLGNVALTIPNIQFPINNAPPTWAKYFSWVRTENLTCSSFYTIVSDTTYNDGVYGYLDITTYNTNSSGWPAYEYTDGDRVRVIGRFGQTSSVFDYQILGSLTAKPSGSGFPTTGYFLKLPYDSASMSSWGSPSYHNYYVEIYTPTKNTDTASQVFYEFGETYQIGTDANGNKVHLGQQQNQVIGTGAQPAIYNFYRGDCYERQRTNSLWIMSASVSDGFGSQVNGNGRPFVVDVYAREIYNPTLVRYGGSYQQGTLINDSNRFYPINFEEYDRSKGDIQRMKLREKALRVFFSRGQGVINVYATEMTNQDGSTNLIGSTQILNPINYYVGRYGIDGQYCSLVSSGRADYYVDPINGYHIRLSQDGITPLSELYKGQYYFPSIANNYINNTYTRSAGGYAKILGVYDNFEEEYVSIFQAGANGGSSIPAYTVGFSEAKNSYTSFYSYAPEWAISAENTIVTWNNGGLYLHDSATKNNFYGTQYSSSISFVFNKDNIIKKTYDYLTLDASDYWVSSTMGDVNTSLGQSSNLVQGDYEIHEGMYHAALQRDNNSLGGIINGDYLKGSWLEAKFTNSGTSLVYLSGLYLGYIISNRNL
jgi:hypothetical protein